MPGTKDPTHGSKSGAVPKNEEQAAEFRVVDKRPFADLDNIIIEGPAEEKPRYPTFVEELLAKMTETERRYEEKRRQVDEEILKMRSRIEADYERKLQVERRNLILPFLVVLDNLERAIEVARKAGNLESLLEGVVMTATLFQSKLQTIEVGAIPVMDQPFDPNLGQAVGVVEVSEPSKDGLVVEEVLRGYRMGDQLLRPAQVRVGKHNAS